MKFRTKMKLCFLPAALGILVFYLLPFLRVLLYSVVQGQYRWKFAGLRHYVRTFSNEYFQMAFGNTLLLIVCCVPVFTAGEVLLSLICMRKGRLSGVLRKVALLPLFLPSVSVVGAFAAVFAKVESPLPVYSFFLWKYMGMGIVILSAAFSSISPEIYEAARMDGAGIFTICRKITIPLCAKPIKFTVILAIVYSFRTFRESFLYYGTNYPPDYSYTLQYYMNNQFLKLDYQTMAAASVMITSLISVLVILFTMERGKAE